MNLRLRLGVLWAAGAQGERDAKRKAAAWNVEMAALGYTEPVRGRWTRRG